MPWRWAISNHKGRDFHKTTAGPKCWLRAFLKLRNCTLKFRTIRLGESYLHQNRRFGSSRVFCRDIQPLSVQKCTLLLPVNRHIKKLTREREVTVCTFEQKGAG